MSSLDKPGGPNQRAEVRLPHHETLYVELMAAGLGMASGAEGSLVSASVSVSETIDVSANGLQVKLRQVLQPGTIHQLAVIRESTGERFRLMGEVKWQRRLPGSAGYLTGLSLFESEETSIAEWKLAVAAMLASEGGDRSCC